jgi:catalase
MAKAQQNAQEMFVRYSDGVETIPHGEAETVEQIAATLLDIAKRVGDRQRHTVRAVHAKSHGLVKAEVTVLADLREELRQGLFAKPASYGAVMRFSSEPGDVLSDHISTPRGLAVKVVGRRERCFQTMQARSPRTSSLMMPVHLPRT